MKIAVFYHCFFYLENELREFACNVVCEQMNALRNSGLTKAADLICVGINGGNESRNIADLFVPGSAKKTFHGMKCRNECMTILMLEQWVRQQRDEWAVLYFHAKGSSKSVQESTKDPFSEQWRNCMMLHCVTGWRECVRLIGHGYDVVGAHWMPKAGPNQDQRIFAGNFWWASSRFLKTVPPIEERERIKISGIESIDSRYEAEVWIGNGTRAIRALDLHKRSRCGFSNERFM